MVLKIVKLVQVMRREDINTPDLLGEVEVDPERSKDDLTVEETVIHPDHTEEDLEFIVEIDTVEGDQEQERLRRDMRE